MSNNFDRTKIVNEKVKPLLTDLKKLCELYNIPYFVTICSKNDDEEGTGITEYYTDGLGASELGVELHYDQLLEHFLLAKDNGRAFGVTMKSEEPMIGDGTLDVELEEDYDFE